MKKLFFIIILFFLPFICYSNLENKLNNKLDNFLGKYDIYKQYDLLNKLTKLIKKQQQTDKTIILNNIIKNKIIEIKKNIDDEENKVNEIIIGYSTTGKEIKAYYRGNIKKEFFGIFADIHGSYEYGTYLTAEYIKDQLIKKNKKQWFIIPTLNPDGLEIGKNNAFNKEFFLKGRGNYNGVDLNRNFCTLDWTGGTFIKKISGSKESILLSRGEKCMDQKETQAIDEVLQKYSFSKIIDLHSKGGIIFIPDFSIEDYRIINLGMNLKNILNGYIFDPYFSNEKEKLKKIKIYEVNRRYTGSYSGTMIDYIYHKYNIPAIILELKNHGQIEYDLGKIDKLF